METYKGLTEDQAKENIKKYGFNEIKEKKEPACLVSQKILGSYTLAFRIYRYIDVFTKKVS
jgi:hypothetical protein